MGKQSITVFTDAASRRNPGPASIAYSIQDSSGKILEERGEFIGRNTNNFAEYSAVIAALKAASKHSSGEVNLFSDSELVVRQLNGKYKVKEKSLKILFNEVKAIEKRFEKVSYKNLPRESKEISRVDNIANKVLDEI